MNLQPPAADGPHRFPQRRNPGDAWITAADGQRYWGLFGAAGLLAVDARRGILLQHRASWSHYGDTWALPGGALHRNESARAAALRESAEEAGVPAASIRPRLTSVLDLGVWSYTTLVGDVNEPFEAVISDPESRALAWVPAGEVGSLPLHPAFARSWQRLQPLLDIHPVVVVDAANVIGSVPDGWWKDRPAAAARLLAAVAGLAGRGVPASFLGLAEDTWFPRFVVVVEGQARSVGNPGLQDPQDPEVQLVRAAGSGDDEIAARAEQLVAQGRTVTVATSDRGLADRCRRSGASVIGAGQLRALLDS